ncbi:MAG: prepilin-type N-terminal cleavage/methylation domain-containing protein [Planctomycetaceae bacterium]|jgi:prepilin-type N-terminal cleavage/methylation domain-containing protein|nr:prepilin-type N-terminal cleavage/methylation domain-containing protein [Planctomycetaceae bacterium]
MSNRTRRRNDGFTLLEILLTTAVLLVGLTAVFQTTNSALKRMNMAKELTEAQNACHAVLHELLAQSAPIQSDEGRAVDNLPNWKIQIDLSPASQSGLYVMHLSALQFSPKDGTSLGVKYQLLRWVPAERVKVPEPVETPPPGNEFESLFQ